MSYTDKSFYRSYICAIIKKSDSLFETFYNVETNQFSDLDVATQFYDKVLAEKIMEILIEKNISVIELRVEFHLTGVINN